LKWKEIDKNSEQNIEEQEILPPHPPENPVYRGVPI
jgi:hypothetical protein